MTKILEAKYIKGRWVLNFNPRLSYDNSHSCDDWADEFEKCLTHRLSEDFSSLAKLENDIWLLELRKKYFLKGIIRSLIARRFVGNCLNDPTRSHRLSDSSDLIDLSIIRAQFSRYGARTHPLSFGRFCSIMKTGFSFVAAFAAWGSVLLRFRGLGKLDSNHPLLLAVHGEWSNRTKHVWHALVKSQAIPPVIILGRPRKAFSALRSEIFNRTEIAEKDLTLVWPFDGLSGLLALRSFFSVVLGGFRAINKLYEISGWEPVFRDLVSMSYRVFMGQTSRIWWNRQHVSVGRVIYGHTGNADTTLLERAQQESGARTIHLFHGVSSGHNFFGYSDVAICQNEHDTRLTRSLGGYKEVTCIKSPRPEVMSSGDGFLLLSNLLHPSNQYFQVHGPQGEFRLWRDVSAAVDRIGLSRCAVTWKPHPQFYSLADSVQCEVLDRLGEVGFSLWDKKKSYDNVVSYDVVLSTVSTTIIDLLRFGRAPMVYAWPPFDQALFASRTPPELLVSNIEEIEKAYHLLKNQQDHTRLFFQFWSELEPSVLPAIERSF